ncbi:unnamed protein product [Alopecurus aequalis]
MRHERGEDMLRGKLWHRRQGGDGHGAEAITVRRSSTSKSSTRCVIGGNMEAGHRLVVAPVENVQRRACHGGMLVLKA